MWPIWEKRKIIIDGKKTAVREEVENTTPERMSKKRVSRTLS